MKKNIAIVILSLISVSSLVYARYQQIRVEQSQMIADANAELAAKLQKQVEQALSEADANRKMAEQQMILAMDQMKLAEEQLAKTKGRK